MEENEYERLVGAGVLGNMVAGAFAGTAEHLVMYPVDSVKTRMQALKCEKKLSKGIFTNVIRMMKEEGALRPMRGATVVMAGSAPAHALYFSSYEQVKKVFMNNKKLAALPENVAFGAAGTVACIFHDLIMTPAEAVKQRMQMCCSKHSRWTTCARAIYSEEGGRAFFRAFTTQISMNLPFQVLQFLGYENFKKILNPTGVYDPKSHLLSGGLAGAFAAAVTTPLDVCKTLLNTQEPQVLRQMKTVEIVGLRNAFRVVRGLTGYSGFFKGLSARVMFQAPATAICWFTYESMNHLLAPYLSPTEQKYETLATISPLVSIPRTLAAATGESSPAPAHSSKSPAATGGAEKGADTRLWETITDLPRPLKAMDVWADQQPKGALQYSDAKFTTIRTD